MIDTEPKVPETKRHALGRGLDALLPVQKQPASTGESIVNIPVSEIKPSRFQPRVVFNEESLKELADSIRERGVIQPIIVARKPNGYELVAGERRWRAVKSLGIAEIPAIVKVIRDSDALELALIENIQRENLNPIEEAHAYDRLMRERAFTQDALSKAVGKNRSSVANSLRLLKLPDKIKDDLADGRLTMGHARALLALESDSERLSLRDQILQTGMNVRQVEQAAKSKSGKAGGKKMEKPKDIFVERLRIELERKLGAKVEIRHDAQKGGSITVYYMDVDDLNRISGMMN
jgi:ParB family chromosome partitioning protein